MAAEQACAKLKLTRGRRRLDGDMIVHDDGPCAALVLAKGNEGEKAFADARDRLGGYEQIS